MTGLMEADAYTDLLTIAARAYDEMDDVLATHGLLSCESVKKSMNASLRFDSNLGKKTIEVVASRVLPFDVHTVGAAAWHQVLQRAPCRNGTNIPTKNGNRMDKDTITASFTLTILAATNAQFRVRQVFQRHVQPDSQVVIVSCRELVPITFSGEPWTTGFKFQEQGYLVVRPSETILERFSVLQSCCITSSHFLESMNDDEDPKVRALVNFVLSATKTNVAMNHQAIENKLLDEVLKCS
uniref:START domain-containing protein n=1 Tax=Globisporangium ultimum (strain ATCC 200006 / CBS 805.95 / DAOM BR144) TaxID=431595 RepID=K3W8U2_GLOUD